MKGDPAPADLDEFGCWLNYWAAEPERRAVAWKHGYEKAVSDILFMFETLHPDWAKANDRWQKKVEERFASASKDGTAP